MNIERIILNGTEYELSSSSGGSSDISQLSGLSEDVKVALLQIARKVAYADAQGQTYYDDLYDALYAVTAIRLDANSIMLTSIGSTQQLTATTTPAGGTVTWASSNTSIATVSNTGLVTSVGYGSCTITASSGSVSATCAVAVSRVTLTSIAADYRQSGTVYDTASLDSLKSDLTVTATYSDSSTATVTEYTLSGTLTAGTSTITVSYGGKTATFNVTVTAAPTLTSISAVYTQSGTVYDTDSLDTLKNDLVVTAHMSDSTTQTVTEYTLSGTLAEGTSTITVSYAGKNDTFTVVVTHKEGQRFLTIDDIIENTGFTGLTVENGNISVDSAKDFSIVEINPNLLPIRANMPPTNNVYRYNIVYSKIETGSYYGFDNNGTGYKFTKKGNLYNAQRTSEGGTRTRTGTTTGFFVADIKDGVLTFDFDNGAQMTFTNANCFAIWASSANPLSLQSCEVNYNGSI